MLPRKKQKNDTRWPVRNTDMHSLICQKYKEGKTMQEIGDFFGFSRQYVQQVLAKYDINREHGGQHLRSKQRQEAKKKEEEKRKLEHIHRIYGQDCDLELYTKLRKTDEKYSYSAIGRYNTLRHNCAMRGLECTLTLREWWTLWENSGKYFLYGQGKDHYNCVRINITKPFCVENCMIEECGENSRRYQLTKGITK